MKCPNCNSYLVGATRIPPKTDIALVQACIAGKETLMQRGWMCSNFNCEYQFWGEAPSPIEEEPRKRVSIPARERWRPRKHLKCLSLS